jgi:uncharacterized membrane protein
MRVRQERGFVLIGTAVSMVLLLAFVGLGFDLGRVYIAHNEAQVFTDSAALTAASQLDASDEGIRRARTAVAQIPMKWNLGSESFKGVLVEFSGDGKTWYTNPPSPDFVNRVRVSAPHNELEIVFLRVVGAPTSMTVPAASVAASNPARLVE